jgi:hypothetical protein
MSSIEDVLEICRKNIVLVDLISSVVSYLYENLKFN